MPATIDDLRLSDQAAMELLARMNERTARDAADCSESVGISEPVTHEPYGPETQQKPRGRKPSDAPTLLVQILDALGSYAAATGQDFDRYAMPGPLGESADDAGSFHWLCASIYPRTFNRAHDTFAKHRAGLCALAGWAKPTDFYRLALPHIAPKLRAAPDARDMPERVRKNA